jgi:hypothetical protein
MIIHLLYGVLFCLLFEVFKLYNLLGVYMEANKSCGQCKLLVMEVIMMSLKRFY